MANGKDLFEQFPANTTPLVTESMYFFDGRVIVSDLLELIYTLSSFDVNVSQNSDVQGNTADSHSHANISLLNTLTTAGDGSLFLDDNGNYSTTKNITVNDTTGPITVDDSNLAEVVSVDDDVTVSAAVADGFNCTIFNDSAGLIALDLTGWGTVKGNAGNINLSSEGVVTVFKLNATTLVIKGDLE